MWEYKNRIIGKNKGIVYQGLPGDNRAQFGALHTVE